MIKPMYATCSWKSKLMLKEESVRILKCNLQWRWSNRCIKSIYQIKHSGTRKTIKFAQDSVHIRDSETSNIIDRGNFYHASYLYSFSHFGPPSPLSETHFFFSREYTEMKSGHLNLCVVPETSVVTSAPPPLV